MLVFRNDTIEKICFHAQSEYPRECCGILLGKNRAGERIAYMAIPTRNMVNERKNVTHFLINPLEIVKAELFAEQKGFEIVGFYHSHPDYESVVSEADKLYMIEGYSYPIISVKNRKCIKIKSFEKVSQTDKDVKEEIVVKEKKNEGDSVCFGNAEDIF